MSFISSYQVSFPNLCLIRFGNFILLAGALFLGNSQSTGSGRASGSLSAQSLAGHPELGTQATSSEFHYFCSITSKPIKPTNCAQHHLVDGFFVVPKAKQTCNCQHVIRYS
jgi:hypothetical protein